MYVGIYYAVILTGTGSSLFGVKFINYLNYFMIFWLFAGTIVFAIGIPCLAPSHQSAKWVFTEFQNYTGYENKGIVFFLGLLQAGWTMVGYDGGVTLSENTKDAARKGPQGIILCVSLALLQGFALTICILFSIQDFDALLNAESPVSEFLLQVTRSKPATIFFLVYMVISQYGSLANSGVSTSRVIWAMSRDGCLPFSNVLYKLHKDTPIRAVLLLMLIMVLTILPVFGTFIYWQAILSTSIIGNNVAYGLPYFCRLVWSRHDMPKGPFDLGKWSIPLNAIAVLWLCFFTVILCLPTTLPVNGEVMNYSSLMISVLFIFSISFWFYKGRRTYNGPY
ncbi:amino acid/polyamine transporter I [Cunninghamella echinulata]|nr:amino acid/polyamine transporter I [Cunninghamella echinulata]